MCADPSPTKGIGVRGQENDTAACRLVGLLPAAASRAYARLGYTAPADNRGTGLAEREGDAALQHAIGAT